jgi:hypothetical protein
MANNKPIKIANFTGVADTSNARFIRVIDTGDATSDEQVKPLSVRHSI